MFSTLTKINKLFQVKQLTCCCLVCVHVGYVHMTVPATWALRTMSHLRKLFWLTTSLSQNGPGAIHFLSAVISTIKAALYS